MKNYLLTGGFAAMLLLGACGNEETEQAEVTTEDLINELEEEEVDASMNEEESENLGQEDGNVTDDVTEFITENDKNTYVNEDSVYEIVERYEYENADENGVSHFDLDGYKKDIAVLLVEDDYGDRYLAYGGTHTNDTESKLDYNGGVEFVTDTGEQVKSDFGIGVENELIETYHPGVERTDITFVYLEKADETPQSITMIFPELTPITEAGEADISNLFYEGGEFQLNISK